MRLTYDPPDPRDLLCTDGQVIDAGEDFTVPDERGRFLLAWGYPSVRLSNSAD